MDREAADLRSVNPPMENAAAAHRSKSELRRLLKLADLRSLSSKMMCIAADLRTVPPQDEQILPGK